MLLEKGHNHTNSLSPSISPTKPPKKPPIPHPPSQTTMQKTSTKFRQASQGSLTLKTMVNSSSSTSMQKLNSERTKSFHIETDSLHEHVHTNIPRSATLTDQRKTKNDLYLSVSSARSQVCKTPRIPGKMSTFVVNEVDRGLQFNEEQTTEFTAIEGMKQMKTRRNHLQESEKGMKGKLKPLDKLQHFSVTSPVVTKGKHKIFK